MAARRAAAMPHSLLSLALLLLGLACHCAAARPNRASLELLRAAIVTASAPVPAPETAPEAPSPVPSAGSGSYALKTDSSGSESGSDGLNIDCLQLTSWPAGSLTVAQWQCTVVLGMGSFSSGPVCAKISDSGNWSPGVPCTSPTTDCSWNIRGDLVSPQPIWPGSSWVFGLITSKSAPSFSIESTAAPVNWACP